MLLLYYVQIQHEGTEMDNPTFYSLDAKAYRGYRLISVGIRSAVGSERIYGLCSRTSV